MRGSKEGTCAFVCVGGVGVGWALKQQMDTKSKTPLHKIFLSPEGKTLVFVVAVVVNGYSLIVNCN